MKKLVAIGLMALSPVTFAKDFNPDLLIGTWQCKGTYNYPYLVLSGTESFTETFYKDGTIESLNLIHEQRDGKKTTIYMNMIQKWRMSGNILSENIENIIEYYATNKLLETQNHNEENLRNNKNFTNYRIEQLNKNKYVIVQTPEDEIYGNKLRYTCHRVKIKDKP